MKGKQLKKWAELVHDDADIEIYRFSWESLSTTQIRSIHVLQPQLELADCNNLEVS